MPWQSAPLVYPDIEMVLAGRYRAALAARAETYAQDVFVSNAIPGDAAGGRRPRMVIVRRDGGAEGEARDQARVSVQVWATTEREATDLARLVAAVTRTFADGSPILRIVPQSGPTSVTDPSGQPLRYIVAEFHTRGVRL
jgi:hypothetical protein